MAQSRPSPDKLLTTLRDIIAATGLTPGDRLPTERALAERLCVPRHAIRTTLARLELEGRVVRSVGSGTFLAATSSPPPSILIDDASPAEIMQARLLIEPGLAHLVVVNATQADFATIRTCLAEAEAAADFDGFEHWDVALHEAIAAATHSRVVIALYRTISQMRDQVAWGELKRRSVTPARVATYCTEHRGIAEALMARDSEQAAAALLHHLHSVRHNLLGS